MHDVAAIVLAAGMSRRMGPENKLLMPLDDAPLVVRVVQACAAVSSLPVTVVLGHEAPLVETALRGTGCNTVFNPDFAEGQMTSVGVGLAHAPPAGNYLLALGDQPFLTANHLCELLEAHRTGSIGRITVPFHAGQRGNPIVIPSRLRDRIIADRTNLGCRHLTRSVPDMVYSYLTPDAAFVNDIDTPQDLARARTSLRTNEKCLS